MGAGLKSYLKTGDMVMITTGKDKGKKGKISRVLASDDRVVVEGLNMVKRHTKPTRFGDESGIVMKEAPIHMSNVMITDPKTGEPTRVGHKFLKDGKKVRIAKKSGETIDS